MGKDGTDSRKRRELTTARELIDWYPAIDEMVLTPRETDILQAIAAGKTNKEISQMLGIGFETVKSHVRKLLAKTGAGSRTELIGKLGQLFM